jgi:hypothetical protein
MDVLLNGQSVAFSKALQAELVQDVVFMGEKGCRPALWQLQQQQQPAIGSLCA